MLQLSRSQRCISTCSWPLFVIILLGQGQLSRGTVALEGARQFWVDQKLSQENSCPCVDVPPLGGLTCQEQKELGKCSEWWMLWGDFCSITCGRCQCQRNSNTTHTPIPNPSCSCTDVNPPAGSGTCQQQRRWGKCNADWMLRKKPHAPNGFCETTCGRCRCPTEGVPKLPPTSGEDCLCTDIQPKNTNFTCVQQKEMGKCQADWMFNTSMQEGYCQTTCGRCSCSIQTQLKPCLPFNEFLNRTEGISMYASLFDDSIMTAFMESNLEQKVTILVPRDVGFQQLLDNQSLALNALTEDPFLVLSAIIQPSVLSLGAYTTQDFLPSQLLLTQAGQTVQAESLHNGSTWQFLYDEDQASTIVQSDIELCQAVVQIINKPIVPEASLDIILASISQLSPQPSVEMKPISLMDASPLADNFVQPQMCVPFVEFLDNIEGVSLYSQLFKDEVVLSVMEASLKEAVTVLIPMDEGFQAYLDNKNLSMQMLQKDAFFVLEHIVTPSIIPSGAYQTLNFTKAQSFAIYKGFNLSVDQLLEEGAWYFKGKEEDLALIAQPDIPLCQAIVHVVTKPLVPEINTSNPPAPSIAELLSSLTSLSLTPRPPVQPSSPTAFESSSGEHSQDQDGVPSPLALPPVPDWEAIPAPFEPPPPLKRDFSTIPAPPPVITSPSATLLPIPSNISSLQSSPSLSPPLLMISSNTSSSSPSPSLSHSSKPSNTSLPSPLSETQSPQQLLPIPSNTSTSNADDEDTNTTFPNNTTSSLSPPTPLPLFPPPFPPTSAPPLPMSPPPPPCNRFSDILRDIDGVSMFASLFEDKFLDSYMETTLKQRMTILIPEDGGFQEFMDENEVTLDELFYDPFLVLISIVQPNIVMMGAYETNDFILNQQLLTQSGSTLTITRKADENQWYFKRDGLKGYILQPNINACNAIVHVVSSPIIMEEVFAENVHVTKSKIRQNQNIKSASQEILSEIEPQVMSVNMSVNISSEIF